MKRNSINNKGIQNQTDLHAEIAHCLTRSGVAPRQWTLVPGLFSPLFFTCCSPYLLHGKGTPPTSRKQERVPFPHPWPWWKILWNNTTSWPCPHSSWLCPFMSTLKINLVLGWNQDNYEIFISINLKILFGIAESRKMGKRKDGKEVLTTIPSRVKIFFPSPTFKVGLYSWL